MKRSTIVWVTALAFAAVGQANAADMYRAPEGGGGYKDSPAHAVCELERASMSVRMAAMAGPPATSI